MKRLIALLLCLLTLSVFGAGRSVPASAETAASPEAAAPSPAVADASQMAAVEEVAEEGMVPVGAEMLLDGDYPVAVESSSSMFRVEKAVLHVRDGSMELAMTMGGKGYLFVRPGTALEAAAAAESERIPFAEEEDGAHTFTIPVETLDAGFPCAAFSKNKELWYDRTLLIRADSLPKEAFREGYFVTAESLGLADGSYTAEVALAGGSGRARVSSPAALEVRDGRCEALIVWSSKNYDYMKVDGEKILPLDGAETSSFRIPVLCFDRPMAVAADTVAMSEPHEISYTLLFDSGSIEAAP